jgi:hypothetical protein
MPSASRRIWSSRTVFPTPRSPISNMLLAGRPSRRRSRRIRMSSRISFRPASSGGGLPAPGAYGLRTGSMVIGSLAKLCRLDKLLNSPMRTVRLPGTPEFPRLDSPPDPSFPQSRSSLGLRLLSGMISPARLRGGKGCCFRDECVDANLARILANRHRTLEMSGTHPQAW